MNNNLTDEVIEILKHLISYVDPSGEITHSSSKCFFGGRECVCGLDALLYEARTVIYDYDDGLYNDEH